MSICLGCGGSFDDSFGFCPHCGRARPKPEVVEVRVNISYTDKWETCRIARYPFSMRTDSDQVTATEEGYFWADAVGLQGSYGAGQSPIYKALFKWNRKTEKWDILRSGMRTARDFLVNQLVKDGWDAENSERAQFLNDFLEDLERKGYEAVRNSEQLKDCFWQGEQDRTLWYFRILIERL